MKFQPLDMEQWERGELFRYFMEKLRCVMSMTADIDVTRFTAYIRERGYKFYPAFMWAVCKAVNAHEEFRGGGDGNGNVGTWDFISPYYAHFHPEDERFAKLFTEYDGDLSAFHARFLADRERYGKLRAFGLQSVPPNTFDVSCLPWVNYRSFDIHVFDDGAYLAPVVTWGRLKEEEGGITLPLSMNIHHAVADGFHLCRFFSEVQSLVNEPA